MITLSSSGDMTVLQQFFYCSAAL